MIHLAVVNNDRRKVMSWRRCDQVIWINYRSDCFVHEMTLKTYKWLNPIHEKWPRKMNGTVLKVVYLWYILEKEFCLFRLIKNRIKYLDKIMVRRVFFSCDLTFYEQEKRFVLWWMSNTNRNLMTTNRLPYDHVVCSPWEILNCSWWCCWTEISFNTFTDAVVCDPTDVCKRFVEHTGETWRVYCLT